MATFTKYNCFVENLAEKVHNLGADTLKIALTNTAPNTSTHTVLADITEIAAGNGYTSGGKAKRRYYAQVGGKLVAFGSAAAAVDALEDAPVEIEAQNRHERRELAAATKKAVEVLGEAVQAVEVVPLDEVLRVAADEAARQQMQAFLRAQEYQALMRVYAEFADEQEIEELLLLAA